METTETKIRSRKQWLKLRKSGLGGSDIATIMGVNGYKTLDDIVQDKLYNVEQPDKEIMRIGREIEPFIAKQFRRKYPEMKQTNPKLFYQRNEICCATPDRILTAPNGETYILEIKNTQYWSKEKRTMAAYQVQWYLYVLDMRGGYIAAFENGNTLHVQPIVRDELLIQRMVAAAKDFWAEKILQQCNF